jgi:histidyl-tRNA synthetase
MFSQADAFYDATEALRQAHMVPEIRNCFQRHGSLSVRERLEQRLQEWEQLLNELAGLGCSPFITIDLTIVRGLAYYTGFVFELFAIDSQGHQGRALAGGGRYDQLFEKLTRHPMPAAGFAIGDATTLDLLQHQNLLPPYRQTIDVILAFDPNDRANGLRCAEALRSIGYSVVYALDVEKSLNKQLKRAYAEKPKYLITLTHDAMMKPVAQIKRTADERIFSAALNDLQTFMAEFRKEEQNAPNVAEHNR